MTWKEGKRACRILGGELAYFNNEAELAKFNELEFADFEYSWLGITKRKNGNSFVDVKNREAIKVSNWNNGEPWIKGVERCVESRPVNGGKWTDEDCEEKRQVVCRFEDDIYC